MRGKEILKREPDVWEGVSGGDSNNLQNELNFTSVDNRGFYGFHLSVLFDAALKLYSTRRGIFLLAHWT